MNTAIKNIDEYISDFPENIQLILEQIRETIKRTAPEAEETIKYGMPTFMLNGNLVYFAAFKNHIGFYPIPTGIEAFKEQFSQYKTGKGSVQFLLEQPMPLDLIAQVVKFRVEQNLGKPKKKK